MRYSTSKRARNKERIHVLALIDSHLRHLDAVLGSNHDRVRGIRFIREEIRRNAHRGET